MLDALAALEKEVEGTFSTFCVDIGITPAGPMFYELQYPFRNLYGADRFETEKSPESVRAELNKSFLYGSCVV